MLSKKKRFLGKSPVNEVEVLVIAVDEIGTVIGVTEKIAIATGIAIERNANEGVDQEAKTDVIGIEGIGVANASVVLETENANVEEGNIEEASFAVVNQESTIEHRKYLVIVKDTQCTMFLTWWEAIP